MSARKEGRKEAWGGNVGKEGREERGGRGMGGVRENDRGELFPKS